MVCQVCQVVVCGKVRYGDPWAVVRPLGQADSARAWTSWRAGQGEAGQGWAGQGRTTERELQDTETETTAEAGPGRCEREQTGCVSECGWVSVCVCV